MMNINTLNVWGPGQILAFSGLDGQTDYSNGLVLRTAFDWTGFDIKIPEAGGAIKLKNFNKNDNRMILAGDFFDLQKNQGAFIDAWHLLIKGDIEVKSGESVEIIKANDQTLIGVKEHFRPEFLGLNLCQVMKERKKNLQKFKIPSGIPTNTKRALWKAYSQLRTQFCSPEKKIKRLWTTPDRWPHRKMWLWDSVFHAAGTRHLDIQAARETISAVLECSREDGFIPLAAEPSGMNSLTQPPLLAFGVKLLQDITPDMEWLSSCYPLLKAYIEWDLKNRDSDKSGLVEWNIEERANCRSGESGMDNSPRFDFSTQLKAIDFNAFLSLECDILSGFAEKLGFYEEADLWKSRHLMLNKQINQKLWSDKENFYFDFDVKHNKMSDVMASSGFLPLVCGAPSMEQARKLVSHLDNPETFKTKFQVPSIAARCKEFYSKDMWRGPVWININWLIVHGLQRYGFNNEANRLISQTMAELERMYLKYGVFFEFYDDRGEVDPPKLLRKGKNIPDSYHQAFHDFGWTATLYIDFAFSKYNNN